MAKENYDDSAKQKIKKDANMKIVTLQPFFFHYKLLKGLMMKV